MKIYRPYLISGKRKFGCLNGYFDKQGAIEYGEKELKRLNCIWAKKWEKVIIVEKEV